MNLKRSSKFEFHDHDAFRDRHAFFMTASKAHWLRYSVEKFISSYKSAMAKERGTELHALAAKLISFGQKLPRSERTLNRYVNDAIGFGMKPEQVLVYSANCFGTADAISFKDNKLRIHDLKTGTIPASMDQLMVYAALFCLEYGITVKDISIELRIYQNDDINICEPTSEEVLDIMDIITSRDKLIEDIREGRI